LGIVLIRLWYLSVVGAQDTYVASTLSFLPRNIGSLHQPDMYPPTVPHAGNSAPIRDEEGGSTPVLDEPDDDDIAVAPRYNTAAVLSSERKSTVQQNITGTPHAGNPEYSYRVMHVNDGIVNSQRANDSSNIAAPPPGSFGPDRTVVYRTEVVDGFQSASEAFHPPPDFFHSETDFNVPPPMTIYQMKDEGFGHASESLPVLSSSARDVVYTVVTTVQQPAPTSYYPVVIEVPQFAEPPPKLTTIQHQPVSFVHPPPAIFNPNLPPPTLQPSTLPLATLPLPPTPPPQPVSIHYTVPAAPANIQVVVPHTLRSPLPAPPKSSGPPPIHVPQHSTSKQLLLPTVRTLQSTSSDKKTVTTSYSSYQSQSILQGIRRIRDNQQRDSNTSVVSVIPTIGTISSRPSWTPHNLTAPRSPVAGQSIPSLLSLRHTDEVARRMNRGRMDSQPSASFAGSKRRLSGSISEDSLLKPVAAKIPDESEEEGDAGLVDEDVDEDIARQLDDDDKDDSDDDDDKVDTEEFVEESGNNYEYEEKSVETARQIPRLQQSDTYSSDHAHRLQQSDTYSSDRADNYRIHRPPFRGRFVTGGRPRLFQIRGTRAEPSVRHRMPRIPRIPRMARPVFRGGSVQYWGGGH